MDDNDITGHIIDAALQIHRRLGPGLRELVYEVLLARALELRGLEVDRQRAFAIEIDGHRFREGIRVDLLVCGRIVVELKSVEQVSRVHFKQVLTYLRILQLPVGLLINFGAPTLREGLSRVVNNYQPPPSAAPGPPPRLSVPMNARTDARYGS